MSLDNRMVEDAIYSTFNRLYSPPNDRLVQGGFMPHTIMETFDANVVLEEGLDHQIIQHNIGGIPSW
jgi:hypothetical protein